MTWKRRIAAVQLTSTADLAANLRACTEAIAGAASEGAEIVTLPECFAFVGATEGDKRAAAESLDGPIGPIQTMLGNAATKHGVWVMGGGMPESVPGDATRTFNTAVVVNPQGELTARYRKLHLFDVDIPGGAVLKESSNTAAGDVVVVADIAGVKMGFSICYDVRFASAVELLATKKQARLDVVIVFVLCVCLVSKVTDHVIVPSASCSSFRQPSI